MAKIALTMERTTRLPRPPKFAVIAIALWAAVIAAFDIVIVPRVPGASPCIVKLATGGFPCAACGGTRTAMHLLRGDLAAAAWQNPLMLALELAVPAWLLVRIVTGRSLRVHVSPPVKRWVLAAAVVIVLANWAHVIAIDGPWRGGASGEACCTHDESAPTTASGDAYPTGQKGAGEAMSASPTGG